MQKYSQLGIIVFLITLSLPHTSRAYNDSYYKHVIEIFEDHMLPRIKSLLTAEERSVIDGIDINVIPAFSAPSLLVTTSHPPAIHISTGFMNGLFQHIDCLLLVGASPDGFQKELCDDYFKHYFEHAIDENTRFPVPVALWAFPKDSQVDRWYTNETWDNARNLMFTSTLLVILMHEYAHHFVGFYDQNAALSHKREIEKQADQWAFGRLDEIDQNPVLGAVISLGYVAHMENYRNQMAKAAENDPRFLQLDRIHSHPAERVRWAYDLVCSPARRAEDDAMDGVCDFLQEQIDDFD